MFRCWSLPILRKLPPVQPIFQGRETTADNVTTTTVRELTKIEKSEEIARMLAGEVITDAARAAAKVLMKEKSA